MLQILHGGGGAVLQLFAGFVRRLIERFKLRQLRGDFGRHRLHALAAFFGKLVRAVGDLLILLGRAAVR